MGDYPTSDTFRTVLIILKMGMEGGINSRTIHEILLRHKFIITRAQLVRMYILLREARKHPHTLKGMDSFMGLSDQRLTTLKRVIADEHARKSILRRGHKDPVLPIVEELQNPRIRRRKPR